MICNLGEINDRWDGIGLVVMYAHLSSHLFSHKAINIKKGQQVGVAGNSGVCPYKKPHGILVRPITDIERKMGLGVQLYKSYSLSSVRSNNRTLISLLRAYGGPVINESRVFVDPILFKKFLIGEK